MYLDQLSGNYCNKEVKNMQTSHKKNLLFVGTYFPKENILLSKTPGLRLDLPFLNNKSNTVVKYFMTPRNKTYLLIMKTESLQ